MKISVIGLGYVGYPLSLVAAKKGFEVVGVEKKKEVVDKINRRELHIKEDFTEKIYKDANIKAQSSVESSSAYIICVPTPVDEHNNADLRYVQDAANEVAAVIEDDQLVVIESTIYPGVCEDIIKPILDKTGKRFLLAHCPERINPGDKKWNVSNIPRVVGGIDKESTERARELYSKIIDAEIIPVLGIKEAEATKILENSFRDINIAFVNEMAQSFYRMGIDINEVIRGASSKPFAYLAHYPGIGVGGHCIAVDPYYMIQKGKEAGFDHDFLILARKINSAMPRYTVKIIQNELNLLGYPVKDVPIAILGLSYKPNSTDDRESPSYKLIKILQNKQADLRIFDPYFPEKSNVKTLDEAVKGAVCIVIATAHDEFKADPKKYFKAKLVVDGRNCLNKQTMISSGVVYKGIGVR